MKVRFCLLSLPSKCTTGNTDLFEVLQSTTSTSKWDPLATAKKYKQPYNKSKTVILRSRKVSMDYCYFRYRRASPSHFYTQRYNRNSYLYGKKVFTPRLPAPSPDPLEILHTCQAEKHSCRNTKKLGCREKKKKMLRTS